jgi:hypothetical protein
MSMSHEKGFYSAFSLLRTGLNYEQMKEEAAAATITLRCDAMRLLQEVAQVVGR